MEEVGNKTVDTFLKSRTPSSVISEDVRNSFLEHFNSNNRHLDLNLTDDVILSNVEKVVYNNINNLQPGSNTMQGTINNIQKTIMVYTDRNGVIKSMNFYPGYSSRVPQNSIIMYGNLRW
ncbi:hypothetical protein [Dysgonomonas sp. 511]|uniref:hypothetical protein n=1 Tax=Dysgonomonas sp. 511 TaxID=2302930 RepID=UPI0013D1214A|nr:hypothetical protein [Dysgonomonas sp. 511]NDV80281.1 hypothetical protein [Dysgonomonas sp. 511]